MISKLEEDLSEKNAHLKINEGELSKLKEEKRLFSKTQSDTKCQVNTLLLNPSVLYTFTVVITQLSMMEGNYALVSSHAVYLSEKFLCSSNWYNYINYHVNSNCR